MNRLNRGLISSSNHWWAVVLVVVLNFSAFVILFGLEDQFEALTAFPVYDTQNDLTAEALLTQLPLYQGEARSAYLRFAAFDFVFPLVAGLFVAVLWALFLRLNTWRIPQRLLALGLPLFPLIVTVWDWLENVSLLVVLSAGASPDPAFINAVLLFKRLKLAGLALSGAGTSLLLLLLLLNVLYRLSLDFNRRRQSSRAPTV
ncbi:MAG: hypothetical protein H7Y11_08825 [Armatimonadetes bacterium]|nr:hypothetical protein [Anaerolineae bacterium]